MTGTVRFRSSVTARSFSPATTRIASCSRPLRAGTGHAGTSPSVTIELVASPTVAADRWRSGEYDVLDDVIARSAVADDETVVQRSPGMTTWYVGFNARRPPLDDPRVRRALAHAVNRNGPAELLRGVAAETGGMLPPTMPGHSHRVAPKFDPDRARALLSEAGHPDGRALGEIVVVCLDLWEDAASDIAAQLAAIGVRVRLRPVASDPEGAAAIEQGAHAYLWAWIADHPDPGGGVLEPLFRHYRRWSTATAARAAAGPSCHPPRPGRTPPHVPRGRAHLDRRASSRGTARLRRPPVVAAPVAHRDVGERDRDVDLRRGRSTAGTAFHAGTSLTRPEPSERRHDGF